MKNFHSTKHFLFLAVVAMETRFKDLVQTGQNFSKSKLKLAHFILIVEILILISNVSVTIKKHFIHCRNWPFSKRIIC